MIEINHEQIGRTLHFNAGNGLLFAATVTGARKIPGVYGSLEFRVVPCDGQGSAWVKATSFLGIEAETRVFQGPSGIWEAVLDGIPLQADFNSKGAAEAGLEVERRRRKKARQP